jgi:exopolysaccharide biosynthesis polyprenyl glycosylphosphotransferase
MPQPSYPTVVAEFRRKIRIIDMTVISVALISILYFRGFIGDFSSFSHFTEWLIVLLIPFLFAVYLSGNQSWESESYIGTLKFYEVPLRASLKTLISISAFAYLIKEPVSRITVLSIITTSTLAILCVRFLISKGTLVNILTSKTAEFLVVASGEEFKQMEQARPISNRIKTSYVHRELKVKDCPKEWEEICSQLEKENFAGLIIGDTHFPNTEANAQISTLQSKKNLEVFLHSPMTTLIPRMQTMENNELIRVTRPLLVGRHAIIKRTLDVVLSITALIVLSPVLLLTALCVKLTSPGPVLYIDQRIGRNNNLFSFPKFRSMVVNADVMRADVLGSPDESMPDRYAKDPRITNFGQFIRRWSLDELPQLWCVLIGTMSIVGPRPILREEDIDVKKEEKSRFIAKPGLTGLWQVSGRKEVLWEARMKQDILYIETWTFLNDLLLIMRTFSTIIYGKGAM